MEASNLGVFADDYVSPAVMRAHSKALEGYGCYKWQDAVQTANEVCMGVYVCVFLVCVCVCVCVLQVV